MSDLSKDQLSQWQRWRHSGGLSCRHWPAGPASRRIRHDARSAVSSAASGSV
jgi:hypothetical protein